MKFFWVLFIISFQGIFSQSLNSQIISIGTFQAYKSKEEPKVAELLQNTFQSKFKESGLSIETLNGTNTTNLESAKRNKSTFYINGYYTRKPNGNLIIFVHIYDPDEGVLIDAQNLTDYLGDFEDVVLDKADLQIADSELVDKISSKVLFKIKINKNRKENQENLDEYVVAPGLARELSLPLKKQDATAESASQVFKLLEEIEVTTATKTKTKIKEAPAAIYVVTQEQIRARGYRTLVDALHDLPGFDFQQVYGLVPEYVHQRGLFGEPNRTLIYVDGVPDNNLNDGNAAQGSIRFPLYNVERIEIVSGPASALYGANAFNGIINIITKNGKDNPGHHVDVSYGGWESRFRNPGYTVSFSTRGSVALTKDKDTIQYSVGGYYYKTDGPNMAGISGLNRATTDPYKSLPQYDAAYALETKACGGVCNPQNSSVGHFWSKTYNNSWEDTYNITAKFSRGGFRFQTVNWQYLQGEGTFANGTYQIDTKEKGLQTHGDFDTRKWARLFGALQGTVGPEGQKGSAWNFRNNSVSMGYLKQFTEKLSLDSELLVRSTQVLSSSFEYTPKKGFTNPNIYYTPQNVDVVGNYARPDQGYQLEERLQYDYSEKAQTTIGLVVRQNINAKDYGSTEKVTFTTYSAYVQQVYKPFSQLSITGGYRYNSNSIYGIAANPRVGLIYKATQNLTLKFMYGTGFREPTAKELFSLTNTRKPNPNLQPERMQATEIGLGYRFFQKYYFSAQGYYNKITNLIFQVPTLDSVPRIETKNLSGSYWNQNQNLGVAKIHGLETELNMALTDRFQILTNYTYSKGVYEQLPASLSGSPSTAGRRGDNPGFDLYNDIYQMLTISPQLPNGAPTIPQKGGIPNIAQHKANVGITYYLLTTLSFYLGINYVDIRRTIGTNPVDTAPWYSMVKLNIRKEDFIYQGMYFQFHINNLLNEQYWDPGIRDAKGAYYPTLHPLERRNIWITVGYNF